MSAFAAGREPPKEPAKFASAYKVLFVCRCGWQGDSEAAWRAHRADEVLRAVDVAFCDRHAACVRADLEHGSHILRV